MSQVDTPITTILSQKDLHAALLARHGGGRIFEGRDTYIGASEAGICPRSVAYRKLHPEIKPDAEGAGRMLAGTVLENEGVQMARGIFGRYLRATGNNQEELAHPTAPLHGHPDGVIGVQVLSAIKASGARVMVLRETGALEELAELPEGDGVFEVKTVSQGMLGKYKRSGLPHHHVVQVQSNMGLSGRRWTLLVMFSRENLAHVIVFYVPFDQAVYDAAAASASATMVAVDKIRQGIMAEDAGLPDADPEHGFCSYCPLEDTCPALVVRRAAAGPAATLPPDVEVECEALYEEWRDLKPEADRFETVKKAFKERLEEHGVMAFHDAYLLPCKGKETVKASELKAQRPDIYSAFCNVGDPFNQLRVKKGKP